MTEEVSEETNVFDELVEAARERVKAQLESREVTIDSLSMVEVAFLNVGIKEGIRATLELMSKIAEEESS